MLHTDLTQSASPSHAIVALSVDELDAVGGGTNWYAIGKAIGTGIRVGATAGVVGALAGAAVVGGALAVDYALDGKVDLID